MERIHSTLLFLLVLLAILAKPGTGFVYSQLCYFTSTNVNPPNGTPVFAGQPVIVATTVALSCQYGGNYILRADLIDWNTSNIISTTRIPYSNVGPYTITLTNPAIAPWIVGWWWLQISVYVLYSSSLVAPPSQLRFWLDVVPYSQTSSTAITTLATQSTESSSTSSFLSLASSTASVITASQSSIIGIPQSNALQSFDLQSDLPILIGLTLGLLVSIPIVIFRLRKR